jgi:hypothetical protein
MASLALAFDILARDRGASKTFDRVGDSAQRAGKKGEGFGSLIKKGAGIAAGALAAAGIVDTLHKIVEAGSGLQQSLGGAQAVFKKSFGSIDQSAKAAAQSLGLSRSEYLELATVVGAGLKNKGLKDYAAQSQNLVKIGADLAAQYGGSTKDAVDALGSAMRGESDPIERYGVSLNETAVNAYLASKGLSGLKGPALDQAKTQARLALITKQSADAMGAFGRESNTYAGVQARLKATLQNLAEQIGMKLLPVLTNIGSWFLSKGLPAVQRFGGWITGNLWPALMRGYRTILPGVQQALAILTGSVGKGTISWRQIGDVITTKVIPFLAVLFRIYLPAVARNISNVITVARTLWQVFITGRDIIARVISFILGQFAALSRTWAGVLRALGRVPGFGWATDAANKLDTAAGKAQTLARNIGNIPSNKTVTIDINSRVMSSRIKVGSEWVNVGLRAAGGPVFKGQPYIVGERRPELFVPSQNGTIVPRVPTASSPGMAASAPSKTDLSEASLQRLAAILSQTTLGGVTVSAGTVDRAIGGTLR